MKNLSFNQMENLEGGNKILNGFCLAASIVSTAGPIGCAFGCGPSIACALYSVLAPRKVVSPGQDRLPQKGFKGLF